MSRLAILRDLAEEAAAIADEQARNPVESSNMRQSFIDHAHGYTAATVGDVAADALTWDYDEDAPKDTEQASAWLGNYTRLQFRHDHDAELTSLRLIRECVCCGGTTTVDIRTLADLAGHLNEECRWTG